MQVRFRPLTQWPTEMTRQRTRDRFDSSWSRTLNLLESELSKLGAKEVVIEVALTDGDIRIDGWPRANARPSHPGVIVSFDSKFGALKYMTDEFFDWQANVRAIALSLEALRKVDRYGVSKRGEQYTGWKAIGAGMGVATVQMSRTEAIALIYVMGGGDPPQGDPAWEEIQGMYKKAAQRTHPDLGGSEAQFKKLQEAKAVVKL